MIAESRRYAPSPALEPAASKHTTFSQTIVPAGFASPSAIPMGTEELQHMIFELVRTRVLESIGASGNWTVAARSTGDTDAFFSETMADMIAWDVANKMLPPTVPNRIRLVA
ncbi:MAG: hypothetical protein RI885_587 [Actinomycetota bacterium]